MLLLHLSFMLVIIKVVLVVVIIIIVAHHLLVVLAVVVHHLVQLEERWLMLLDHRWWRGLLDHKWWLGLLDHRWIWVLLWINLSPLLVLISLNKSDLHSVKDLKSLPRKIQVTCLIQFQPDHCRSAVRQRRWVWAIVIALREVICLCRIAWTRQCKAWHHKCSQCLCLKNNKQCHHSHHRPFHQDQASQQPTLLASTTTWSCHNRLKVVGSTKIAKTPS